MSYLETTLAPFYLNADNMLKRIDSCLLEEVLKLIAIDLRMGQTDRHNKNLTLQIRKDNGNLHLAELYDFSTAYQQKEYFYNKLFYENPFIILRKNNISLSSLEEALFDISNDKKIKFNQEESNYYQKKDSYNNKTLIKIQ